MKKKRQARLTSGRLAAGDRCPNCLTKCDGVTGAVLDGPFKRTGPTRQVSIKGKLTMCTTCGAMLVFADEDGHLRLMTPEERATTRLDPVLQDVVDHFRRKKVRPPDFTRKNYN